jgi:hypothetical protein
MERVQFEDMAENGPRKRDVGDDQSRAALSHVPKRPLCAIRVCEGVVLVQDGTQDDENTQPEDAAENELSIPRKPAPIKYRKSDDEHNQVTADVEDHVCDEVIRGRAALVAWGWNGPIVVKRTTPDSKIENLHNNEACADVGHERFENEVD